MIFLFISCFKAIAQHESFSFSIVDTIKDNRFDESIISIFLSEEDLNTEVKQLDNDEDEEKNVTDSMSCFAARNK
jgi:hypothetical protein